MRRFSMTLAVGSLLISGCYDVGVAPGEHDPSAAVYGADVPTPYVDLGLHAPPKHADGTILAVNALTGVTNGSFEVNGGPGSTVLDGWTTFNAGSGAVFAQTGDRSPISGFSVARPTDGDFAAMTDQFGPGTHIWYQDVTVGPNADLVFDLYLGNRAGVYFSPSTLSTSGEPNQQFRADIMDPAAPIDDVGAGVLANVYQTQPGDAPVSGYDRIVRDLRLFRGETVRLRFAQVDNQSFFQAGVDNVSVGQATGGLRVVHSATGSGITSSGEDDTRVFAFSAVRRADGSLSGEFNLEITEPVLGSENPAITRIEAEVVCLSVVGNRAWVGGKVKSASNPSWVGGETGWAVEDNGAGSPSPDRISLMNVPNMTPGFAQSICNRRSRIPNLAIEGGSVKVR